MQQSFTDNFMSKNTGLKFVSLSSFLITKVETLTYPTVSENILSLLDVVERKILINQSYSVDNGG